MSFDRELLTLTTSAGRARMPPGRVRAFIDCAGDTNRKRGSSGTASMRDLAHGAAREVVGGGVGAIDAAIDVCAAELGVVRARLALQAEVMKLIRTYASDDWLRAMAGAVLEAGDVDLARCLPRNLFDPELAETHLHAARRPVE
jgi:hypothetical protein